MLHFGWQEMAAIGGLALIVLGPEHLPEASRAVIHWLRLARRAATKAQREMMELVEAIEARPAERPAAPLEKKREEP